MSKNSIHRDNRFICLCPLEGVIDIISKKWALLIINEIGNHGRIRYKELQKELGRISPKTLADTLKGLQNENLVDRETFNEISTKSRLYVDKARDKIERGHYPTPEVGYFKKRNRGCTLFL